MYISLEQIPNVEIGLLSYIEPNEEKSTVETSPLPKSYLYYVYKLFSRTGINFGRTEHCKHRGSCFCSCLASSTKAGALSYLIKSAVTIVFSLKKILKNPKLIIYVFGGKDSVKFGFFIFGFLIILRTFVCTMRRVLQPEHQKYAFMLGGLIGGTAAAFILEKGSRQTLGLFLISRAIDITYRSLVEKKIIPDWKYYYPFLYGLMMFVTGGYALGSYPASMSPELHKFYLMFTNETVSDQQMRRIWIERKNIYLLEKGVPTYNALDYLPKARKAYYEHLLSQK